VAREPVAIPQPPSDYDDPSKMEVSEKPRDAWDVPGEKTLAELHESDLVDFLDPRRFGYIQDRDHVAGFLPHRFSNELKLKEGQKNQRWHVQRLELVSLLAHEAPVAYVSDNLPRMDELTDAPTRPLNSFEQTALKELQEGEDLRIGYGAEEIRMLGSIRALNQCVVCHHSKRGELLGAFSYRLRAE
jgi:hypothetical protein